MALYYELPVYRDVYDMTLSLFRYTKDFPREYKFTLGQDIKRDSIELVRYLYKANSSFEKTSYLEKFMESFEVLKFEIRLCADLRILGLKVQADLANLMNKIGRQITGWRKSLAR